MSRCKNKRFKTRSAAEQVSPQAPTLEQAGIDRKLSSRVQRMADIPAETFVQLLERYYALTVAPRTISLLSIK